MAQDSTLVAAISAQLSRAAGHPAVQATLHNALAAASGGASASARSWYAQAQQLGRTQGLDLPGLPTAIVADVVDAVTKAFAPGPSEQGPPPAPGAPALTQAEYYLRRPLGGRPTWHWVVGGGAALVAASMAYKLAKFALVGGAVAGGALLVMQLAPPGRRVGQNGIF